MFKLVTVLSVVLGTSSVFASDADLNKYLTIKSVQVEVETVTKSGTVTSTLSEDVASVQDLPGMPQVDGRVSQNQKANIGQVIQVAKDIIALGEKVYEIVKKGKPVLNLKTAPLSVLPKNSAGQAVDVFEMEGWSMPLSRKVRMSYKNGFGSEVVSFEYTIVFAHSGSMNGAGAYITAAQIIPSNVRVSWGFEFNADMRLVGLQNHGTKANPVAGAIISLNYKVESVVTTIDTSDTYHLTGKGQIQKL